MNYMDIAKDIFNTFFVKLTPFAEKLRALRGKFFERIEPQVHFHCSAMSKILRKSNANSPLNDFIAEPAKNDLCRQPLVVYLLDTRRFIKVVVSKENTIEQVARHICYVCLHGEYKRKVQLPYSSPDGCAARSCARI